eukprot:829519-Pleurochrysis_carterae.AAC.1
MLRCFPRRRARRCLGRSTAPMRPRWSQAAGSGSHTPVRPFARLLLRPSERARFLASTYQPCLRALALALAPVIVRQRCSLLRATFRWDLISVLA